MVICRILIFMWSSGPLLLTLEEKDFTRHVKEDPEAWKLPMTGPLSTQGRSHATHANSQKESLRLRDVFAFLYSLHTYAETCVQTNACITLRICIRACTRVQN